MMSQLIRFVTPDDQFTWSVKEILEEIPGFQFKGPGWYSKDGNWMLAIGTDTVDVYTLQIFYDRDPRGAYAAIAGAPVQLMEELTGKTASTKKPFAYGGLVVLVVGMFIFLPLSGFLLHRFQGWGLVMLMVFALVWGRLARFVGNRGSKNEGKKDERRTG